MKKVIIIAPHPDDETLGVGGTILKHKNNGDQVYWLIVTNIFEKQGFSQNKIKERQAEINKVADLYKFDGIVKLDIPTMTLTGESLISLIPKISEVFNEIKPEILYLMNRSDAHSDHRVIFDAVMACTKSFRYPFIKKVLMYECISETEFAPSLPEKIFIPNYYVDITLYFDKKIEIMRVYESELGVHPFPRSLKNIEALATYRGSTIGALFAEAFQLIKYID